MRELEGSEGASRAEGKLLAVVRVRSGINRDRRTIETLESLGLNRPQTAVLLRASPQLEGQLAVIRNVAFWGPIDKGTLVRLLEKRGRTVGGRRVSDEYLKRCSGYSSIEDLSEALLLGKAKLSEIKGLKRFFRLSPGPGARRKGSGAPRALLGDLGPRANEALARMI
ncbi:MAG: uL30 family ribosomal protein [Candidatus Brockarchaeota archaeon]|nr:uL30 family ribosomal protein [Candidatus Brockarchaeota archaeon]